jgi:RimJ/RimL family protein N-acetyltransferase
MQELTSDRFILVAPLFGGLPEHLAIAAVLGGAATGRVWVDDTEAPAAAVVWVQHRIFAGGDDWSAANHVIHAIAAAARQRGDWGIGVYAAGRGEWDHLLGGLPWRQLPREYWEISQEDYLAQTQRALAPGAEALPGLRLRTVDAKLLADSRLGRLEQLREEMCSERPSVEDFLARSFGVCLVDEQAGELSGWCLSEYNYAGCCEVGIEVVEEYQRRGLGTLLTQALLAEALGRHGMQRVGWHCLAANAASVATARRAGLRPVRRYDAAVVLLQE